ncbi:MAG: type II toxin-antitoxin system HipA family toxin, partial [Coriobacteriales bacterium]|nr:type II toxin-antitoxin system HipA family toxin [Coriobacteriales bacterium]
MFKIAFSLYGRRAGVITRDGGRVQLSYDPDYLSQPTATPLSLSLPLSATPHLNRPIEAYLRGLLPDNTEVRRRWAQTFGLRDRDTLGLIRAIGMDCAGGALFALEDELQSALERPGEVESLTDAQIGAHLRLLRSDEAAWHEDDEDHWSLAGGQSKFTLVKTSDGWGRARGSAPSTHIIKPGIGRIPAQALIEHVSMRALALLGLPVAASVYHEFNSEPAIVVERFDRHLATDGSVVRLHSEDFLQAFGMDPSRKYESDGGPGVARVATLLAATTDGSSHERFMQAVIANYLLGAPDAHAKNYSLLLAQRQVSLAPLYDIASGLASESITGNLRYRKAAMSIGGETLFGEVTGRNWDKFAIIVQQDRDKVRATVTRLATQLPDALHDTIKELPPRVAGRPVLTKQILPR